MRAGCAAQNEGYTRTSDQLESECGFPIRNSEPCDNVDLIGCIKDFQSYFNVRFAKQAKLTRRVRCCGASPCGCHMHRTACVLFHHPTHPCRSAGLRREGGKGGEEEARFAHVRGSVVHPRWHRGALVGRVRRACPALALPCLARSSPVGGRRALRCASRGGSQTRGNGDDSGVSGRKARAGRAPQRGRAASLTRKPPLPDIEPPAERKRASSADRKKSGKAEEKSSRPHSDGARPPRPPKKTPAKKNDDPADASAGGGGGGGGDLGLDLGLAGAGITKPANSEKKGGRKFVPPQIIDYRKELNKAIGGAYAAIDNNQPQPQYNYHEDHVPKPLTGFASHYTGEMKDLAETVARDIYSHNPDVKWTDLIGVEDAKKVLKEAVVYPIKYPTLFRGILSPWKGLLLFGPPGTGKTMLAKAVATECATTFFNISASTIVSKWRGDSEKLVRVLFELARYHAPSTVFMDEIDAIMSTRGSGRGGDHEGSRRMKTELLVQMDGLNKSDDLVFMLAASNLPWELDPAMLRRLEKRILVDLPTREAREHMIRHHLPEVVQEGVEGGFELKADLDYALLAGATQGYSGSDLQLVCKEAAMRPLRNIFHELEKPDTDGSKRIRLDPILTADVEAAIATTKPSASNLQEKYISWKSEFQSC